MFNKLLLTYLVITTSTISPNWAIEILNIQPTEIAKLSKYSRLTTGYSFIPGDLPIIEFIEDWDLPHANLTIHTLSQKKCQFKLLYGEDENVADVNEAALFAHDKVIFSWIEQHKVEAAHSGSEIELINHMATISIVDMNKCTIVENIKFPLDVIQSRKFFKIVFYDDGFDTVFPNNVSAVRQSFNLDGKKISEPQDFRGGPIWGGNVAPIALSPSSTKSRSGGFFMASKDLRSTTYVSFVDANGVVIKKLLTLHSTNFKSHSDQSSYAICWQEDIIDEDTETIYCARFNEYGREILKREEELADFQWIIDTRMLKDGGLVVFCNDENDDLYVIRMQSNCPENTILKYDLVSTENIHVIGINEDDGTFEIIFENSDDTQRSIKAQKFNLPDGQC